MARERISPETRNAIDRMIESGEIRSFSDLDIVLQEMGIDPKDWAARDEDLELAPTYVPANVLMPTLDEVGTVDMFESLPA